MASDPMTSTGTAPAPLPTPLQGFFILAGVIVGVALYLALSALLHIASPFAGFLLLLYWAGLKRSDPGEFPAALFGALGGVLLAYLLWSLPLAMGGAGSMIVLLLICAAIYALVMGWLPILVNNSMMLLLTVGTIDSVQEKADFIGMAASVLVGAVFAGILLLLARAAARRRATP